jgi:hypothetical protein
MVRAFSAICAFGAGAMLPVMAAAAETVATVSIIQGEAMIRREAGYEAVTGSSEVSVGDTVVAKAGSTVKVSFSNGCSLFLGMGMVFDVPAEPPCAATGNSVTGSTTPPPNQGVQDWSAATQTVAVAAAPEINIMPYLLGAGVVGGAGAAAVAFSSGGGSAGGGGTPVSP